MHRIKSRFTKLISSVMAAAMIFSAMATTAFAAGHEGLEAGTYTVDAELSCYVSAMGGVEFGAPLLTSTTVDVKEDGSAEMTLNFGTSSVTIYGVTCDTFINAGSNAVTGYWDGSAWKDASYTLSSNTAESSTGMVNYVDSMTFTLPSASDTYQLAMYVDSNVMGVQFGTANSRYAATLKVDWATATKVATPDESSSQSATVEYTVNGGYEVEIPATITVDSATRKGSYTVTAKNFVIGEAAYVTVTANESGSLSNGTDSLAFTNALESKKLTKTGDALAGTVEVTSNPSNPGKYTGTINFTINYFSEK